MTMEVLLGVACALLVKIRCVVFGCIAFRSCGIVYCAGGFCSGGFLRGDVSNLVRLNIMDAPSPFAPETQVGACPPARQTKC